MAVFATALAARQTIVGFGWDDGVYVAAGEWLARGKGYVLANRVGYQAVPTFMPGYPLLCALVWLACGTARAIGALGVLSAACAALAWALWYRVLRREESAGTAVFLVAVPAFSYAALSVAEARMADAPYALIVAAAAALWVKPKSSTWSTAALVLLAAVAPVLRAAGAVLTLAVILLLLSRRRWLVACGTLAAALALELLLQATLRAPEPSYAELTRAAWADGGAGGAILLSSLTRDLWESAASFVVPPVYYSGAVQRLVQGSAAAAAGYGFLVAAIAGAALLGGWRRLRADRWGVGDLAFVGAASLVFLTPLGVAPRFLVPYGPVICLWLWEGVVGKRRPRRNVLGALMALVLLGTLAQAARHVWVSPASVRDRSAAYFAAADTARRQLGQRGLLVAEFPEALWYGRRLRAVSTTTPLENVLDGETGFAQARRRVQAIGRGCLLDTETFPVSRQLYQLFAARPGAERLGGLDARFVRAVCWGQRTTLDGAGAGGR